MSATMDVKLDPNESGALYEAIVGECCFIPEGEQARGEVWESVPGCQELAEFEIEDTLVTDPYSKTTYGCAAHAGLLIGHEVEIPPSDLVRAEWKIRPVEVECKACAKRLPWLSDVLRDHAEMQQKRSDGSMGTCGDWWRENQEGKAPA